MHMSSKPDMKTSCTIYLLFLFLDQGSHAEEPGESSETLEDGKATMVRAWVLNDSMEHNPPSLHPASTPTPCLATKMLGF